MYLIYEKIRLRRVIWCVIFATVLSAALILARTGVSAADGQSYGGKVTTSSTSLKVRSAPSASASRVSSLSRNAYVTVVGTSGMWYKVEYGNGLYGYCSADYLSPVSGSFPAYVSASGGNLNVRSGAGTSYSINAILPHGRCIVVIGQSGDWYRILYDGAKTGYVSKKYISVSKPSSSTQSGYTAVYLSVPSYKQNDSRWASDKIGSSGYTIGQIGCTTTALAMTESYRLGYTVYPDAMEDRLSYSLGGALYWPSNYVQYYNSDYLAKAYGLLKEGKPVIIGAKTSSGKTHWVVITGFKGGTLTLSNFLINDPGSASSTTLATYMAKYPIYMKLTYYK